jgi:hypothetical protein
MKNVQKVVKEQGSTIFLRVAVTGFAAGIAAICIFLLPLIWRAVPIEYSSGHYAIYAVIIALYLAAIPFFYAVYQVLNLLSFIGKNAAFSGLSVKALQRISWCGVIICAIFAASLPFFYIWAQHVDAPGLMVIGLFLTVASLGVAVFAAVAKRLFQQAIEIKSENDLTV